MPELHVLAGPNGAGKSSFSQQVRDGRRTIDYAIPPVINPDVIAKRMNPSDPDAAALAAGREAIRSRDTAIANGESFAIETTLSGHSELETIRKAKAAGYSVTMAYIGVESAEMSALRVLTRAQEETRTVPLAVVLRRYPRSLANLTATLHRLIAWTYTTTAHRNSDASRVSIAVESSLWQTLCRRGPHKCFVDRSPLRATAHSSRARRLLILNRNGRPRVRRPC